MTTFLLFVATIWALFATLAAIGARAEADKQKAEADKQRRGRQRLWKAIQDGEHWKYRREE